MSKFGLDWAVGPQSDVWASQDRVTICRMEQDPHPVLRRIFQAGGRERRDMIRNSARCNRYEVGGPARNATYLGIISPTYCTRAEPLGRTKFRAAVNTASPATQCPRRSMTAAAGNPPGCSNPVPSGCLAVQIDPLMQNGTDDVLAPANQSRHVGTPLGAYVPGLPVFTWRDAAQNTSFKASCAERGPPI